MRGTIQINDKENNVIVAFLLNAKAKAIKNNDTYIRDSLGGQLSFSKNRKYFSIGVTATKLVLREFEKSILPRSFRYKQQNYAFTIKN